MELITFLPVKGGVGNTTLTANVAASLAKNGRNVLAIDMDPQNSLGTHLQLDPSEPWGLVHDGITLDTVYKSPDNVNFVPFGKLQKIDFFFIKKHLSKNKFWLKNLLSTQPCNRFDYILIDSPSLEDVFQTQAIAASNRIIVTMNPDPACLGNLSRTLDRINNLGGNETSVHLLVNKFNLQSKISRDIYGYINSKFNNKLLSHTINFDITITEALGFQIPISQHSRLTSLSIDIENIATWISNCHLN